MRESFESKVWRWLGNLHPAYRSTGARVSFISHDFQHVEVTLPCNWRTKNHMGITWGGSLYAALDPIYGVMLNKLLGRKYRVIDRQADIKFLKPGKQTLFATFDISTEELLRVKDCLSREKKIRLNYQVTLKNKRGDVHAECNKQIQIDHLSMKN